MSTRNARYVRKGFDEKYVARPLRHSDTPQRTWLPNLLSSMNM
jgi:hypothetical protein